MRKRPTFRQSDVTRAVAAARKAGLEVTKVELDTTEGRIMLTVVRPEKVTPGNELDSWLDRHAYQA